MRRLFLLIMILTGLFLSASSSAAALMPRGQALTWLYYISYLPDTGEYSLHRLEPESKHAEKIIDFTGLSSVEFIRKLRDPDAFFFRTKNSLGYYDIYRLPKNSRTLQNLTQTPTQNEYYENRLGDWLIFELDNEILYRMRLDGTERQAISQPFETLSLPITLVSADDQSIYWMERDANNLAILWRFSLDDERTHSLPLDFSYATFVHAGRDAIYVEATGSDEIDGIYRIVFDSGQVTRLTPSDADYYFVALDPAEERLYVYQLLSNSNHSPYYEILLSPPYTPQLMFEGEMLFYRGTAIISPNGQWLLVHVGDAGDRFLYRWDIQRRVLDRIIDAYSFEGWLDATRLLANGGRSFIVVDMDGGEDLLMADFYTVSGMYINFQNNWITYMNYYQNNLRRFNIKTRAIEELPPEGLLFSESIMAETFPAPPIPNTPIFAGLAMLTLSPILTYIFTRAGGLKSA